MLSLERPVVMGLLNATPDSFYQHDEGAEAIRQRTRKMLTEGATIVDVGACSTRPGYTAPDEKEEMQRLREALKIVREEAPKAIVSVDTFRADVAKMCVEEFGVQIVNDISEGSLDKEMFKTVAELGVPYILTHNTAIDETEDAPYMAQFLRDLGSKVEMLHEMGVCDIILDPGIGFGKSLEANYALLSHLERYRYHDYPILIGISRKSMLRKLLGPNADPENGTTVLNTIALAQGADILRVHNVANAKEALQIIKNGVFCQQ